MNLLSVHNYSLKLTGASTGAIRGDAQRPRVTTTDAGALVALVLRWPPDGVETDTTRERATAEFF